MKIILNKEREAINSEEMQKKQMTNKIVINNLTEKTASTNNEEINKIKQYYENQLLSNIIK